MSKQECTNRVRYMIDKREKKIKFYRYMSFIGTFLIFISLNVMLIVIVYTSTSLTNTLIISLISVLGIILKVISYNALKKINKGVIFK